MNNKTFAATLVLTFAAMIGVGVISDGQLNPVAACAQSGTVAPYMATTGGQSFVCSTTGPVAVSE